MIGFKKSETNLTMGRSPVPLKNSTIEGEIFSEGRRYSSKKIILEECMDRDDDYYERRIRTKPKLGMHSEASYSAIGGKSSLILGSLPLLASLVFSGSHRWVDLLILLCMTLWVYYVLEVPWKLVMRNTAKLSEKGLKKVHLILIFSSPLVAAYSIYSAKVYFKDDTGLSIFKEFNIPMFIMAALLRPIFWILTSSTPEHDLDQETKNLRYRLGKALDRLDRLECQIESLPIKKGDNNDKEENEHFSLIKSADLNELEERFTSQLRQICRQHECEIQELWDRVEFLLLERQKIQTGGRVNRYMQWALGMIWNCVSIPFLPYRLCKYFLRKTVIYKSS